MSPFCSSFSAAFASIFFITYHVHPALAQSRTPLVLPCADYPFPQVVCMTRYGTMMPQGFQRTILYRIGFNDYYPQTHVPDDPSFANVANASFLVWDAASGLEVLGSSPQVEFMFTIDVIGHEAPVYEPDLKLLYFSQLQANLSSQLVVDLNKDPPTLSHRTASPPIILPTGATFHEGLIYSSGSATTNGIFIPSIVALNASTGEATTILNNYFGFKFNTIDDLAFAPNGDIFFTDDWYANAIPGLNHSANPQLETAVYRFVPSTGLVQILTDSFVQPNGIAFSPSGDTVYITDTSVDSISIASDPPSSAYVPQNHKTVYAFDVLNRGTGIANPRAIFLGEDRVPDGIKVARNGYIVTATGHGVDVLDPAGIPLVRVQTNFTVVNIAWAGEGWQDLWMVGIGGVARVKWNLPGIELR